MKVNEQVHKFTEFFYEYYRDEINDNISKGNKFLIIDFKKIMEFDLDIANLILDEPEELIKAAEIAIETMNLDGDVKNFKIRFINLPQTEYLSINEIRSKHLNKIFTFKGIIRQKSDVRPQTITAKFECPQCGNVISIIQLEPTLKEVTKCSCGRKGKFRVLNKELTDVQGLVLEESPEDLEGGQQPKRINVLLKDDLVSPLKERKTNPGFKVLIIGIIKEIPIITRTGSKSTRSDLVIEANNIMVSEESFIDLQVSPKEEKEILEFSKDKKIYDKMIDSIAPSIYGYENIKEALILQLFGGVRKKRKDGSISRGDFHILLVGDTGIGKSHILKMITIIAPKARYISGRGSSGAGMTASVVRDEFLKGWSLEAGAIVLASNGILCLDEAEKASPEDISSLHEGLENQTISISKANIQATLTAKTTVLAAANPKYGRFDPYEILAKQITMPPTLINRFDLIFPIRDIPDKEKDEKLANFISDLHMAEKETESCIKPEFLRKYIAYAKQKCKPKITHETKEEILKYYLKLRNRYKDDASKAIPISPRQLEALLRLSEASAKVRLSNTTTKEDAKRAIKLLHYCLSEVGVDPETGKLDVDLISVGIPSSQRVHISEIKGIINTLQENYGGAIPIQEIVNMAEVKGVKEDKTEEILEKLKHSGDIMEPRRGFIQKIS